MGGHIGPPLRWRLLHVILFPSIGVCVQSPSPFGYSLLRSQEGEFKSQKLYTNCPSLRKRDERSGGRSIKTKNFTVPAERGLRPNVRGFYGMTTKKGGNFFPPIAYFVMQKVIYKYLII